MILQIPCFSVVALTFCALFSQIWLFGVKRAFASKTGNWFSFVSIACYICFLLLLVSSVHYSSIFSVQFSCCAMLQIEVCPCVYVRALDTRKSFSQHYAYFVGAINFYIMTYIHTVNSIHLLPGLKKKSDYPPPSTLELKGVHFRTMIDGMRSDSALYYIKYIEPYFHKFQVSFTLVENLHQFWSVPSPNIAFLACTNMLICIR